MKVPRAIGFALAAFLLVGLLPIPSAAAIGVDDPHLRLGKIDPGHQSTHLRDVTNTGTSPIVVDAQVVCPCPIYVTVNPSRFELAPGAKETLRIDIDIPAEADPGAHDTKIQVTERSSGGSGGTAVASATISAFFQVRTATLFLNPPSGGDTLPVRFVNAYEETLDVTLEGTLEGIGVSRAITHAVEAHGSGPGARVTTMALPLPFQQTDPPGGYTITLFASWSNDTTGTTGASGPHRIDIVHGALIVLRSFETHGTPNGLEFSVKLRSLAPEPVEAWFAVTLTPVAGGQGATVESERLPVDAFGDVELVLPWQSDLSGRYTVQAQAFYLTKEGMQGSSSTWPPIEVALSPAATEPDPEPATDTTPPSSDPGASGSSALMGIVALAGLGVGAAVAILVNRRGPS